MMAWVNLVVVLQVLRAMVNAFLNGKCVSLAEKITTSKFLLGSKLTTSRIIVSVLQKDLCNTKNLIMKSNGCPRPKMLEEDLKASIKT